MAILPQIDNSITNGLEPSEIQLPSKTYRINDNVLTTKVEEGEPTRITSDPPIEITDKLGKQEASVDITSGKSEQVVIQPDAGTTVSGTNEIVVRDANINKVHYLTPKGNTQQDIRTGKNLINVYSNTSLTIDKDGWITYSNTNSGSSTSYANLNFDPNTNLSLSTNYYVVLEVKSISSTAGTSTAINLSNNNTASNKGQFTTNKLYYFSELQADDVKIDTITTRDSFDGCETFSRSYISIPAGATISITFRLSVLAQQPTAETFVYEAYGISPSVTYPAKIKNVGDNINLFNLDNTLYPIDTDSTITHTFSNETVTLNGSLTSKRATYLIGKVSPTNYICTLKPNTTYTILIEIVSGTFTGANTWILQVAGVSNYLSGSLFQPTYYDNKHIKTFTTGNTALNVRGVQLYNNDTNVTYTNLKFRIKLVESENVFSYTPYNQSSVNISVETKNKFTGWIKQCYTNSSNGTRTYFATGMTSKLIEIKPKTIYRMSGIATGNYGKNKYISYYDKSKIYISRTGSSNVAAITQTSPENAYYCALGIAGAFADTTEMDNFIADSANIQFEEGASTTTYQAYGKQEIQFPLVNGQVLHSGDYLAKDGIHQVRGTLSFDGTESGWNLNSDYTSITRNIQTANYKTRNDANINCTRLQPASKDKEGFNSVSSNSLYVKIDGCTTLQQYKDKLAEWAANGIPLAFENDYIEPVVIPYTEAQQEAYNQLQNFTLYENYIAIINKSGDADAPMDFQYNVVIASPSPEVPSDIRNVGDNINILEVTNGTLTNANGVDVIATDDKIILNGKATANTWIAINPALASGTPPGENRYIFEDATYTFSTKLKGDYSVSFSSGVNFNINTNTTKTNPFNTIKNYDLKSTDTFYNCFLRLYTNDEFNNAELYVKFEKGSKASYFTPYNYGSMDIELQTRNICSDVYLPNNQNIYFYADKNIIEKTITISLIPNVALSDNSVYLIVDGVSQGIIGTLTGAANTRASTTITIADGKYANLKNGNSFYFQLYKNQAGFTMPTNVQIENGNKLSDYIPHIKQSIQFPFTSGQVLHNGDYLAADGIHQVKGTLVLTGQETTWTSGTTSTYYRYWLPVTTKSSDNDILVKSTHFEGISYNQRSTKMDDTIYVSGTNLGITTNKYTTLANFKTWLAEQYATTTPVTIEYELAEEIITPYTAVQQQAYDEMQNMLLNKDYSLIDCIDEIKPTIRVTYFTNEDIHFVSIETDRIEGYIDKIEAVKQAIYHILMTERYAYLIYDNNYGIELDQYIGKDLDYIQATIEQTLKEALTYDLRITDVKVNSIKQIEYDKVLINFTAYTIYGDLVLEVNVNV